MTNAQKIGALAALIAAAAGVYLGTRTVTNPTGTRACIAFAGTKPSNLKVTRAVVGLSPEAQTTLGLTPVTGWAYAGVEVQAQADADALDAINGAVKNRILGHIEVVPEAAWDRTAQGAVAPACQVLVVRQDDPAIDTAQVFQCGCSTGSNCTWNGSPGPKAVTFDAGTFSGTGCRRKPCIELMGQGDTMPAACR